MPHSVRQWANAAHHFQLLADGRRQQEIEDRKPSWQIRKYGLYGVGWGLVFVAFGMLANYLTGGGAVW